MWWLGRLPSYVVQITSAHFLPAILNGMSMVCRANMLHHPCAKHSVYLKNNVISRRPPPTGSLGKFLPKSSMLILHWNLGVFIVNRSSLLLRQVVLGQALLGLLCKWDFQICIRSPQKKLFRTIAQVSLSCRRMNSTRVDFCEFFTPVF